MGAAMNGHLECADILLKAGILIYYRLAENVSIKTLIMIAHMVGAYEDSTPQFSITVSLLLT